MNAYVNYYAENEMQPGDNPPVGILLCTRKGKKMVEYANEVRRLFMGESGNSYNTGSIEITFSTRSLLRWAELTIRYQPLANQGIQPVAYALDRALGFRACKETRAMLHELVQRVFTQQGKKSGE